MFLVIEDVPWLGSERSSPTSMNIRLETGSTAAIVGPSHSGKSAFLLMAAGYLRPSQGRVYIDIGHDGDEDLSLMRPDASLIGLGPILGFSPLFDTLTVREHIYSQVKLLRQKAARQRTQELLQVYDLTEQAKFRIKDLDHYAQFRTSLAVATAGRPKFVLLDEPLKGLSEEQCAEAQQYFRKLNENDVGVLFTSAIRSTLTDVDMVIQLVEGEVEIRANVDRDAHRVDSFVAK
jgi:ABC-type multidrug transport system ATPase subunit